MRWLCGGRSATAPGKRRRSFGPAAANQRLSRPSNAIGFYERGARDRPAIKARADEGTVLNSLGLAYNTLSRHEQAIGVLDQALAIEHELNDRDDQAMALNNMGIAYTNLSQQREGHRGPRAGAGAQPRAQESRARSLGAQRPGQLLPADEPIRPGAQVPTCSRSRFTARWATVSMRGRHWPTSRSSTTRRDDTTGRSRYHRQALAIHREVKNRTGEGIVLNNMGIAFIDLGRDEDAIESLEQALAIAREVKRRGGEANSLQNLGNAHRNLKHYEKALEYYDQALAMQREVKNRMGEGSLLNNLGDVAHSLGQYDKAIAYSEQALTIAREVKERADEADALKNLARTERDRGNLARAHSLLEQDLAINEALRADIYNPISRATYFAAQQSALETYIDVLMRQHAASPTERFDVQAFESSERARARSLLELLAEAGAGIRQGVDVGLLDRERTLAKELNTKAAEQAELASRTHAPEQVAALNQAVMQLEADYEQVQVQNPAHQPALCGHRAARAPRASRASAAGARPRDAAPGVLAGRGPQLRMGRRQRLDVEP